MLKYEILTTENKARRGVLKTAHGEINTPAFMPVGTAGTVFKDLKNPVLALDSKSNDEYSI